MSFFSTLLNTGALFIATASGLGIGAAAATVLKSKGLRPFILVVGVVSLAAAVAQYFFWLGLSHGTTTIENKVLPSGIGTEELVGVLFRQCVVLVVACLVARNDVRKQVSSSTMWFHGALSAPAGLLIGVVLQVLLTVVLAAACFSSMETCHF